MSEPRILVDTSVLVRERDAHSSFHPIAVAALTKLVQGGWELCTAPQCVMEYWAVATRPAAARGGLGLSVQEARADVERLLQTHTLLSEPADIFTRWLDVVETYGVSGRQVWDARVAAVMKYHTVQPILAFNTADFERYDFLQVIDPSAV